MTLSERLRALADQEERDVAAGYEGCSIEHTKAEREAADALDAKDARIKELEGALRAIIEQWDTPNWKLTKHTGAIINRAREALK